MGAGGVGLRAPHPALRSVPPRFAPNPGRAPPTPQRGARVPPPLRIWAAPGAGGSVPAAINPRRASSHPHGQVLSPVLLWERQNRRAHPAFRAPAERARGASARQDLGSPFPAPLPPRCSSPPAPARTPLPHARGRFGWIGAQRGLVERLGVLGGPGMNVGVAEREGGDGVGGAQDPPRCVPSPGMWCAHPRSPPQGRPLPLGTGKAPSGGDISVWGGGDASHRARCVLLSLPPSLPAGCCGAERRALTYIRREEVPQPPAAPLP